MEKKQFETIEKYPVFYPYEVFGFLVYWVLQVLLSLVTVVASKGTAADVLMNWQWDLLIFGGGGFLLAVFVLSCILLYRNNGKNELVRQLLIILGIIAAIGIIGIAIWLESTRK